MQCGAACRLCGWRLLLLQCNSQRRAGWVAPRSSPSHAALLNPCPLLRRAAQPLTRAEVPYDDEDKFLEVLKKAGLSDG